MAWHEAKLSCLKNNLQKLKMYDWECYQTTSCCTLIETNWLQKPSIMQHIGNGHFLDIYTHFHRVSEFRDLTQATHDHHLRIVSFLPSAGSSAALSAASNSSQIHSVHLHWAATWSKTIKHKQINTSFQCSVP